MRVQQSHVSVSSLFGRRCRYEEVIFSSRRSFRDNLGGVIFLTTLGSPTSEFPEALISSLSPEASRVLKIDRIMKKVERYA